MSNPTRTAAETSKAPQYLDNSRFAAPNRKRLSAPALRTFLAIADLWGLTEEQRLLILGYPSRSTYHNWCRQAREHGIIHDGMAISIDAFDPVCLRLLGGLPAHELGMAL